jgi:hypothetical protein
MPLKKLLLKPGVNRENTRYTTEGGWYDCDKIRFRQGTPEKIGGWERISNTTFTGICRSLWNWVTLAGQNLLGVGTHTNFFIEQGGAYNDITPLRYASAGVTFDTTNGSPIVEITDIDHGAEAGDPVVFYAALPGPINVGGLDMEGPFTITEILGVDTYTVTASSNATSTATSIGAYYADYPLPPGPALVVPLVGWGAGGWGNGPWGIGIGATVALRLWSQSNFGQNLIFGPRGGRIYFWDAALGLGLRGVDLSTVLGAASVPTSQNYLLVSDVSRFVLAFGANPRTDPVQDPMLIRWSDQEDALNWEPSATNQAGSLRLSAGSEIITARQARQEILVWTDSSVYSLQYQGPPFVWGAQLVGENISIAGQNAVAYAGGTAYWMGNDKFYKYDGRTQTLRCDLRQYIFGDINRLQFEQVYAGTNEGFNEVWWFYCSANSDQNDRYVVYNYAEDLWFYGQLPRSAWLDSGLRSYPIGATYANNLVDHEVGVDDRTTETPVAIPSYITSAEFDLDDGHQFCFVWRMLPDVTFRGSEAENPQITMTLYPLKNSGSGYTDPASVGGVNSANVTRTAVFPVEEFTGQVFTRIRGRQIAMKVESSALGVTWQLGAPRIDMRTDGRR